MSDKSYVTMEQQLCLVCGQSFDTGAILLDRRLRNTFDRNTVTGWGLCPDHQKLHDAGFVALVECDPAKSGNPRGNIKPQDAYRTGTIAHLRRTVMAQIFSMPVDEKLPMVFVEPGVIEKIQAMQE